MSMNQIVTAVVFTLALSTAACAKSEPEQQPAAPTQEQMSHEDMDHGQMKDGCDMQGMDMSNMSAEEHQAMMDKCQKNDAADDGQADGQHDEHGGH